MTTNVHLVDDDPAVRRALSALLEEIGLKTFTFESPETYLAQLPRLVSAVVVLDMRMPVMSGLKLQEEMLARNVDWPTIVLTGHGDIDACRRAFRNGAVDFLTKPVDEQDLIDAIQRGHRRLVLTTQQVNEQAERELALASLTARERETLERIAQGFSTKDIALALNLSPRTVESHRAAIAGKLGTTSVAELTRLWLSQGRGTP
ncbi:MAG: response regulator transcription factor [Devosia sp.]